jgi:sterol carrier protein 2
MAAGSLSANFQDRTNPLDKTLQVVHETVGTTSGPFAAQIFGNGGEEYCQKYGATWKDIAAIAAKVRWEIWLMSSR